MALRDAKKKQVLHGFLHIFALAEFALLPPVFSSLTKSQDFFIAHGAGRGEMLLFTFILAVIFPVALALLATSSILLGRRLHVAVQGLFVSVLVCGFLMPHLKDVGDFSGVAVIVASWMVGLVVALAYTRFHSVRSYATFLAPFSLIFPLLFLLQSQIVFPKSQQTNVSVSSANTAATPVFVLVFDEFSTPSLLNEDYTLDEANFPNFAAFARHSYWFRNATTVAELTTASLGALLTGCYPESKEKLPTVENYPNNLFTILGRAGYRCYSVESMSSMCPPELNDYRSVVLPLSARIFSIFSDVSVFAGHLFLKEDLTGRLPSIQGLTAGFTQASSEGIEREPYKFLNLFEDFTGEIGSEKGVVFYARLELPHIPYKYLPSGKQYTMQFDFSGWQGDRIAWGSDGAAAAAAEQRYELQVQFVDRLLGIFVGRLKDLGVYDKSLIVITADHGVSYRAGIRRRTTAPKADGSFPFNDQAMDILKVPAFIKLPEQTSGVIVDGKFQNVDFLPTVLSSLKIGIDAKFDGRSFVASGGAEIDHYRMFDHFSSRLFEHDLDIFSRIYDFGHKFRTLDRANYFCVKNGPYDSLLGRVVSSLEIVGDSSLQVELQNPSQFDHVDLSSQFLPSLVKGILTAGDPTLLPATLAIAVNGTIEAVARSFADGASGSTMFNTVIPERAFRNGGNSIQIYVATQDQNDRIWLRRTVDVTGAYSDARLDWCGRKIQFGDLDKHLPIEERDCVSSMNVSTQSSAELVTIIGWAFDKKDKKPPECVVLFYRERFLAYSRLNRMRHDIALDFGDSAFLSGFEFSFARQALDDIEYPEELQAFAILADGVASPLVMRPIVRMVQQEFLPAIKYPTRVVKSWDFSSLKENERGWTFPGDQISQNENGVVYDATKQGGGPSFVFDPEISLTDCGAVRVDMSAVRMTPSGSRPESFNLVRLYWAGADNIPPGGGWPFSDQREMDFEALDPSTPNIWTARINMRRACQSLQKLVIAIDLPRATLGQDETFKVNVHTIEIFGY